MVEPGFGGRGNFYHYTYDDVLAALALISEGTTGEVHRQLEPQLVAGKRLSSAEHKRRKWLAQALLNLANAGRIEYVIDNHVYYWRAEREHQK